MRRVGNVDVSMLNLWRSSAEDSRTYVNANEKGALGLTRVPLRFYYFVAPHTIKSLST